MNDERDNPYRPEERKIADPGHDAQLLRELRIVNAQTVARLGPLPPDGLPTPPRRKPNLPHTATSTAPLPGHDREDDPMKLHQIAAAVILPLAVAAGCSQTTDRLGITDVHVKQNPHPQERYELTFTIHDAPGPFDSVTGKILYVVSNEECVPTDTISGAKSRTPGIDVPVQLKRLDDGSYQGQVDLDLPIDENYFGLGVCNWKSNGAYLRLAAHAVTFSAGISQSDIEKHDTTSTYFLKNHYFGTPVKGFTDGGATHDNYVRMSDKSRYFSVTIAARKVAP